MAQVNAQLSGVLQEAERQNKKLTEIAEAFVAMPFEDDLANALKSAAVYSVVPALLLPFDVINGQKKFQIPVTFSCRLLQRLSSISAVNYLEFETFLHCTKFE